MSYTPDEIKKIQNLRKELNASISLCSKVLIESEWNEIEARTLIIKEFEKIALKKKDNRINHSLIFISVKPKYISYIILGCETDFSLNNEKFYECGTLLVNADNDNIENLNKIIVPYIGALGENIQITKFEKIDINDNYSYYLHNPIKDHCGTALSIIQLSNGEENSEIGKRLAQHICVFKPKTIEEFYNEKFLFHEEILVKDILNYKKLKEFIEDLIKVDYSSLEEMKKNENVKKYSYIESFLSQIMQHIFIFKPKTMNDFLKQKWLINSSIIVEQLFTEIHINNFYLYEV